MRRKLPSITVCVVLVFTMLVSVDMGVEVSSRVRAAIIYVDDNGGEDFISIQDAIDAASEGDTIYIYNGTYTGAVDINKSINLIGESREGVLLNGGIDWTVKVRYAIVNISNINIEGPIGEEGEDGFDGIPHPHRGGCWGGYGGEGSEGGFGLNVMSSDLTLNRVYVLGGIGGSGGHGGNCYSGCPEWGGYGGDGGDGGAAINTQNSNITVFDSYIEGGQGGIGGIGGGAFGAPDGCWGGSGGIGGEGGYAIHSMYSKLEIVSSEMIGGRGGNGGTGGDVIYDPSVPPWIVSYPGDGGDGGIGGLSISSSNSEWEISSSGIIGGSQGLGGNGGYGPVPAGSGSNGHRGNYIFSYSSIINATNCTITVGDGPSNGLANEISIMNSQIVLLNTLLQEIDQDDIDIEGASSYLEVKWFLTVYVIDINENPVGNATVWINDTSGLNIWNLNTDSFGSLTIPVSEYKMADDSVYNYNPHFISASKNDIKGMSQIIVNYNKFLTILLDINNSFDPPVADCGSDQTVYQGELVQFFGSSSYDPNEHWIKNTVDNTDDVGNYNSITVDSQNNPHISYYHSIPPPQPPPCGDPLKYAKISGREWNIQEVDSCSEIVGLYTSIAIDSHDYPHISYFDYTNNCLKYARWNGSVWNISIVSNTEVLSSTSIFLDSNDLPHIVYSKNYGLYGQIYYSFWNQSSWEFKVVDNGSYCSLVLDSNDIPHIIYNDNYKLKYGIWNGIGWDIQIVEDQAHVTFYPSIYLDSNDKPHISYYDYLVFNRYNLKYAQWNETNWIIEIVDPNVRYGDCDIALDSNNNPHISYSDYESGYFKIKHAECIGDHWKINSIDENSGFYSRKYNSIAIDSMDSIHVSYCDTQRNDLKYSKKIGGINSYLWDFGDGTPCSTKQNPTYVYNAPGIYNVTLTVTNNAGYTDTDTCVITVVPATPVSLYQGWNIISLPTIQSDTNIKTVLQSIEGIFDAIQMYNSSDNRDPWKHYQISKPSVMNDLTDIDHTMGLLIHMTKSGGTTLFLQGDSPTTNQSINLHLGWNMVGYPSTTHRLRDDALNNLGFGSDVDVVQYYDSQSQTFRNLEENEYMEPGMGFWIHATTDSVWEVPL